MLEGMPIMNSRYPDFIQRMLLHERTLDDPLPKEPTDYELVIRLREADDAAVFGEHAPVPRAPVALVRAGLFYYHNALEDSHKQAAKTEATSLPTGTA